MVLMLSIISSTKILLLEKNTYSVTSQQRVSWLHFSRVKILAVEIAGGAHGKFRTSHAHIAHQ